MSTKQKRYWLVEDETLAPFYAGIETFCEQNLPQDDPDIADSSYKIFADPIEGYVHLSAWEVAVVDTPLFQRLRSIRQLGLASLVYPTLGYCRFQHTLGVLARLKQVLDQLRENEALRAGSGAPEVLLTEPQYSRARLAALCHDLGHCVYSHVSEAVVQDLPGTDDYPATQAITAAYSDYAGRRIPIAEVFAVAILTSAPFIRYLHKLGVAARIDLVAGLAQDAGRMIMGLPFGGEPGSLFLGQLMSSGLDVDKLDYMLREAHLSGISLGISLDWLLKKLFVKTLNEEELPHELRSRVKTFPPKSQFRVLALDRGGQFAFEEFCVARLTLHEKIYLHQKIRAAEAFVKSRLRKLASTIEGYSECHRWLYLKESQFEYPDLDFPAMREADLFNRQKPRSAGGLELERISKRDLLYRAFAFGWFNAIGEPLIEAFRPTDKLMAFLADRAEEFVEAVKTELLVMRKILGDDDCPEGDPEILVDLPRIVTLQQGHETLYIEHPTRLTLRWTMPIDKIVEYYHNHRALAYVFTEGKYCACVLLAAEKVAWSKFKVLYVQEAAVNPRVVERARVLKEALNAQQYYADARPLQPVPGLLTAIYSQTQVASIAKKLARYEPRTKRLVTPASVTTYLAQFPAELQEAGLAWLGFLEWINPSEGVGRAIAQVLQSPEFKGSRRVALCPLGATSDSANRIAYDMRDIDAEHRDHTLVLLPLVEAVARRFDGYIIYDDNTNTGFQALNIVAGWMGKEVPEEYSLAEEHVMAIDPAYRDEILSKPVGIAFAVATEDAPEKVCSLIEKVTNLSVLCKVDRLLLRAERVFSGVNSKFQHRDKLMLRAFLQSVATEVFTTEGRSPSAASNRAMGDGEAEGMIVFPYNCPTMTVPSLWVSGKYQGSEWLPLVERARRSDPDTGDYIGEDA